MAITAEELATLGSWRKAQARRPGARHALRTAEVRVLAYCEYVRCLITAAGVSQALRISDSTASQHLQALTRCGVLAPGRGLRVGGGRPIATWQWAND